MINRMIQRRGLKANLPVLDIGEFGFCTDTNELYIGTSSGNIRVDVNSALSRLSELEYLFFLDSDVSVVGLEADFKNNRFTRLSGAVGKTGGSDFDSINAFGGRKRCIVTNEGVILAYFGDEGYVETGRLEQEIIKKDVTYPVGTEVQVMVYQPKFYYKVAPIELEPIAGSIGYHQRKTRYYISDTPKSGFKLHPAFIKAGIERPYVMMSAYEGCLFDVSADDYVLDDAQVASFTVGTGDKLCSIANAKPISGVTQNLTRRNCGILAENRGTGWTQTYAAVEYIDQLLFAIEYASFNTQNAIGLGVIDKGSSSKNEAELTGQTAHLGNISGMANGTNGLVSVSYRGKENPWGNIWKFVDGINVWGDGTMRGGVAWIADNAFAESKRTDNYQSVGFTFNNLTNFISAMGYGNPEFDWVFFASESAGNSNTPIGDTFYIVPNLNGDRVALSGGESTNQFYAGVFAWLSHPDPQSHLRYLGGRLAYVPEVTE